jgi:hypothetical protein
MLLHIKQCFSNDASKIGTLSKPASTAIVGPCHFTGAENEAKWMIPRTLQTEKKAVANLLQDCITIDIANIKGNKCPKCWIGHKNMTPIFADAAKATEK